MASPFKVCFYAITDAFRAIDAFTHQSVRVRIKNVLHVRFRSLMGSWFGERGVDYRSYRLIHQRKAIIRQDHVLQYVPLWH